jgi:HTH-like domain/Integrase core domain
VSLAALIATQRVDYGIPHVVSCRALEVSPAWFYKWRHGDGSPRRQRRKASAAIIAYLFHKHKRTYGSPRIAADLRAMGWRVSENTAAALMREQDLVARRRRRRRGTTKPDKSARKAPDLVRRDFAPREAPDVAWVGDLTEIPTDEGKLQLAAIIDLHSRRVPGFAMDVHHDAALARAALCMAIAVRGGSVAGVIFHTDYAEVGVKPRNREMACSGGVRGGIPRFNVRELSQTVEGLKIVFGERFDGQGVDCGGGCVDGFSHHGQGREGVENCCGGGVFVAEESHDDRQRDPLLVKVHGFGLAQQVAVDVLGDRGTFLARNSGSLLEHGRDRVG